MSKYGWGGNYQCPTYYQPPVVNNTTQAVVPEDCKKWLKNLFTKNPIKELAFTKYSWAKINCYINLIGDLEITGLGKIQDGKIIDIIILKQSVKSTYVSCNDEAIADYLRTLTKEERKTCSFLDWHSHVNMAVQPSPTDWDNYEEMLDIRMGNSFPIMIINKTQNVFCGNYFGKKKYDTINVVYDLTPLTDVEFETIYEECKKDVQEKCVEEKIYTASIYNNYYENEYIYNKTTTNINSEIDGYADKNISKSDNKTAFDSCSFCNNKLYTPKEFKEQLCSECIEENELLDKKGFCVTCGKEIISNLEKSNKRCSTCSAQQMFKSTDAEVLYCNDCGEKLLLITDKDSGLCRSCRTKRTNRAKEVYQPQNNKSEQVFCQECGTVLEKRVEKVNNLCIACLGKYVDLAELEVDEYDEGDPDEIAEKCSNCQTELFTPIEFEQGLCEDCISNALQIYKKAT